MRLPAAAGGGGPGRPVPRPAIRAAGRTTRRRRRRDDPWSGIGRPLLIGGALTSAALSLAGAAYVAWRLNRPPASPMARAARAVARTRLV